MKKYDIHFIVGIMVPEGFAVNPDNDWVEEHTAESLVDFLYTDWINDLDGQAMATPAVIQEQLDKGYTCCMNIKEVNTDRYKVFFGPEPHFAGVLGDQSENPLH